MIFERRHSWPALAIMWVGLLTLAVTLKAAQKDLPVQPPWIMAALAGLYLVLAVLAERLTWRALALLAAMAAAHALTALLCGFGYAAVEGHPRDLGAAFQHGLWDYLPGTALQFGFACLVGLVLDAWLQPWPGEEGAEVAPAEDPSAEPSGGPSEGPAISRPAVPLPDITASADLASALQAIVAVPGIAAALAVSGAVTGTAGVPPASSGVWERDPQAAWQRVHAVLARAGTGLNSVPLGPVSLLIRAENGQAAALLVTADLAQTAAHDLLRQLWGVAQKEWGAAE